MSEQDNYFDPIIHTVPTPITISWNWVSVKDRLPEYGQDIIVYAPMDTFICMRTVIQYLGIMSPAITHWMPLPELPK